MKENGRKEQKVDLESRSGRMDLFMKENGNKIKWVEKENFIIAKEIFMMDNSRTTKPKDMVDIFI